MATYAPPIPHDRLPLLLRIGEQLLDLPSEDVEAEVVKYRGCSLADAEQIVTEAQENNLRAAARHEAEAEAGGDKRHRRTGKAGKFAKPTPASEIKIERINWLYWDFLPLGALSGLFGPEGIGKSVFAMTIAAQVSRGTLPGALDGKPANAGIFAYEDNAAAVLVPRLGAARDRRRPCAENGAQAHSHREAGDHLGNRGAGAHG
jgi:hypothetical protein